MDERAYPGWVSWLQTLLGAVALILAIITVVRAADNRELQRQDVANQAQIARAQSFANIDNGLVQLTARTAAETNDSQLRDLLAKNGVTFRPTPVAAK